jgi:hypothetical protein
MKTKSSSVITGGTLKRPPTSRNGIVPVAIAKQSQTPSDLWKGVKPEEIGTGFEVVLGAFDDEKAKRKPVKQKMVRREVERENVFTNKFIHIKGDGSEFVWFEVLPPKPVKPASPKKKKPINFKNKLDKRTKAKFSKQLDANILETASFIMKDLLPKTLSLHSAIERVAELSQQLIDEKVTLPLQYLQSKQLMAVHLRIIRHVSEQFNLNDEERKLMALEFTRPWSQS